ncbi:hypothetical protein FBU30_004666 [Linnemannia zychae]|nr:hypothetical protein FBU30_004666 [Linnemannia zychae]
MAVNARKRLVQEGYLSAEKEIQFLDAILTFPRNCKSSGAWHHSEEHDRKGEPQLSSRASYPWVVHLWVSELERVREMVQTYPGHESLWYHLRFLYYGVRWLDSETDLLYCCTSSNGNDEQRTDTENEDNEEGWFVSLTTEQSFVEDLLSKLKGSGQQGQDSSLSLETDLQMQQKALASKYLSWVERLDIGRHQG